MAFVIRTPISFSTAELPGVAGARLASAAPWRHRRGHRRNPGPRAGKAAEPASGSAAGVRGIGRG